MNFDTVIQVGAGGTGSHLCVNLVRSLPSVNFLLFDGDKFTKSNLSRQLFPCAFIGEYKALTIANEVKRWLGIDIKPVNNYLFGQDLEYWLKDSQCVLFVDCSDNPQTKKQMLLALHELTLDYIYTTGGVADVSGSLVAEARIGGEYITPRILELWPSFIECDHRVLPIEKKWDCWAKAHNIPIDESAQTLIANLNDSHMTINWLWNIQVKHRLYYYGRFDLDRNDVYLDDEMMIKLDPYLV